MYSRDLYTGPEINCSQHKCSAIFYMCTVYRTCDFFGQFCDFIPKKKEKSGAISMEHSSSELRVIWLQVNSNFLHRTIQT